MNTPKTVALSAIVASLATVPAVQIAQQSGIVKVAGDVTIREPIAINQLPPLSFALAPLDLIQLTDATGPYTIPEGKRLLVREFWHAVGGNQDHPTYESAASGTWLGAASGVAVIYDPTGEYDALTYAFKTGLSPFASFSGSYVRQTEFTFFESGTVIQVRDNEANPGGGGPEPWSAPANALAHRSVLVGQLVDA